MNMELMERSQLSVHATFLAKVWKRLGQLKRLGPAGLARTAYLATVPRLVYPFTDVGRELARRRHRRRVLSSNLPKRLEQLKKRVVTEVRPDAAPLLRDIDPQLDAVIAPERRPSEEIVLGEFDQDGYILPLRGPISRVPSVSESQFLPRKTYHLRLVDLDGRVGVRKEFADKQGRFIQDLEAALNLSAAGCPIPPVLRADCERNTITYAFVRGEVVREMLARAGAKIRDRNVVSEKDTKPAIRLQRAREVLPRVLSQETVDAIADAMLMIHRQGYVLEDLKYGNIVLETGSGKPIFLDFERALPLNSLSRDMSMYLRDIDRHRLNRHFGTELLTANMLRNLDQPPGAVDAAGPYGQADGVYAPAIVRDDIHWGPIWNTDVGVGRWNFILRRHMPIPHGGSLLDLGANNGFNALQILRSGATSAVGVEIDPRAIRQGEFLKRAFEWADNELYDFRYIQGSHAELPSLGLPQFDLVTALCTLYYVSEDEMRETARFVRQLSPVFVVQCNTDRLIDRLDVATFRKASIEFALEILADAGFTNRTVVAPPGYSRPLVIGRAG